MRIAATPSTVTRTARAGAAAAALLVALLSLIPARGRASSPSGNDQAASANAGPHAPKDNLRQAEKAAERGDKALVAGKMQEALEDYRQAVQAAPGDLNIARRAAVVRAEVVQSIVDAAEAAALSGDIDHATDLMLKAIDVDPGNTIVAERLAQMRQMPKEYVPAGEKADYELRGPAVVNAQAGAKSINVRGDAKSAYEQVAGMFGIKVAFDPELPARNLKLRVENVDFHTAMRLLNAESHTFYRAVNPTLIFVADDTIAKRKEYSEEVEQSFALEDSVTPEDATEMMRVLREITNSTRISMDSKTHSLVVRETADKVALAGQLIRELEQSRRDVMLDIDLLEVDRNSARNLGITPTTSLQAIPLSTNAVNQLTQATDVSNLLTLLGQVFSTQGVSASPTDVLPVGGGKSTYLLTMPSASAAFSQGLSLVKSGREILLRAQDGKAATFFVGTRFPVTLSLLSTSLGGTTIGGAVTPTTFARTDFAVGQNPVAVIAADFNNDAKPDLAVANQTDNSITILLNNDNGNFTPASGSPIALGTAEQGPSAIASRIFRVTDATHLVQPNDLVIANKTSGTVSVLLGSQNFDGTFSEAAGSPFSAGSQPSGVVIADFNNDGFLDIAIANEGDNTITVLEGDGQGGFKPFPKSPFVLPAAQKGPIAMLSATFDNSGKPEIALLNAASENIGIFQASFDATFDGTFTELSGSPVATGANPVAFAAGDLNADGFADFAIVNQSSDAVTVLLNDSTGFFTAAAGSPLATASTPAGVAIADFTNDGLGDIVVTNNGSATLGVYAGLGSGQFSPRFELSVPAGPLAVGTAQLTTTGLPDAIVTSQSGANHFVTVLLDPSSFSSGTTGSVQTPYPGSEYVDLGVKVKATPSVHDSNEVTLQLEFEIRALAGSSVNGIPVITNRTVSQTVRLREGEPSIIAGLLDREETKSLSGIPGFANLPGLGYAFGNRAKTSNETELLILVTPRRMNDRIRQRRTKYAGRGDTTTNQPSPPPAVEP